MALFREKHRVVARGPDVDALLRRQRGSFDNDASADTECGGVAGLFPHFLQLTSAPGSSDPRI